MSEETTVEQRRIVLPETSTTPTDSIPLEQSLSPFENKRRQTMNQTEREIFFKLLIDLFLDQPSKTATNQQEKERDTDENTQATPRGRDKSVYKTNPTSR